MQDNTPESHFLKRRSFLKFSPVGIFGLASLKFTERNVQAGGFDPAKPNCIAIIRANLQSLYPGGVLPPAVTEEINDVEDAKAHSYNVYHYFCGAVIGNLMEDVEDTGGLGTPPNMTLKGSLKSMFEANCCA